MKTITLITVAMLLGCHTEATITQPGGSFYEEWVVADCESAIRCDLYSPIELDKCVTMEMEQTCGENAEACASTFSVPVRRWNACIDEMALRHCFAVENHVNADACRTIDELF